MLVTCRHKCRTTDRTNRKKLPILSVVHRASVVEVKENPARSYYLSALLQEKEKSCRLEPLFIFIGCAPPDRVACASIDRDERFFVFSRPWTCFATGEARPGRSIVTGCCLKQCALGFVVCDVATALSNAWPQGRRGRSSRASCTQIWQRSPPPPERNAGIKHGWNPGWELEEGGASSPPAATDLDWFGGANRRRHVEVGGIIVRRHPRRYNMLGIRGVVNSGPGAENGPQDGRSLFLPVPGM